MTLDTTLTTFNKEEALYPSTPHRLKWKELLHEAIERPGILSEAFSNYHNYSFGNTMALAIQAHCFRNVKPGPTASKSTWKKNGRTIIKDQVRKAFYIWIPNKGRFKKEDEKTGEEVTVTYTKGFLYLPKVYMLYQTEGEPFATPDHPEFDLQKAIDHFELELKEFKQISGNTGGYAQTSNGQIAINPLTSHPLMVGIHEIAHCLLHKGKTEKRQERWQKEIEAEGVAYICARVLKLEEDMLEKSRGYMQHWLKDNEINEKQAQRIMGTANKILQAGRL